MVETGVPQNSPVQVFTDSKSLSTVLLGMYVSLDTLRIKVKGYREKIISHWIVVIF